MPQTLEAHISASNLEAFWRGELDGEPRREVVRHLLDGCRHCSARLRAAVFADSPAELLSLESTIEWSRGMDRRVAAEREAAREMAAKLCRHPPRGREVLAKSSARFHNLEMVKALGREARSCLGADIAEAVRRAELAVLVADRLSRESYGETLVNDVRARARVELSRAQRRSDDLRTAAASLARAEELLADGTGDPLEYGALEEARGQLLSDQRRFDAALRSYDRALRIYHRLADPHRTGRTLVSRALCLGEAGEPEEAIHCLQQASALIDREREPRWVSSIYHNMAYFLAELGRREEALAFLHDAEALYDELGKPADLQRLRWVRARVLAQEGLLAQAARLFAEVRGGLLALDLPIEAADAGLELAVVLARLGRTRELQRVALEVLPIFESRQLSRDALAALALFRQAVQDEAASLELVQQVARAVAGPRQQPRS